LAERKRTKLEKKENYFTSSKPLEFIPSGCALLDCIIGGGWAMRRVVNIVGDKNSGKTLLAIEACANFLAKFPEGRVYYQEAEAAFDMGYAAHLGMPIERIDFVENGRTVEAMRNKIVEITRGVKAQPSKGIKKIDAVGKDIPKLYIVDSLDALSASEESRQDMDEAGYGGARKAGDMSEMFRKLTGEMADNNMCLMIISQIRDNVGVMFGKKTKRSGGRALDFYASQVVWLYAGNKIKKKIKRKGVENERKIGVHTEALCDKNKVSMPLRDCKFPIYYAYGVKDYEANLTFLNQQGEKDWLKETTGLSRVADIVKKIEADDDIELENTLAEKAKEVWHEIEDQVLPKRRKYR
jgi:RecA/RadA recombinase